MTLEMSDYFEKLNRELNDSAAGDDYSAVPRKSRDSAHKAKDSSLKLGAKAAASPKAASDKPLTMDEKMALSEMIKSTGEITR